MSIDKTEAAAALDDISRVIANVKQSRIYRTSASMLMLWGGIVAVGYMFAFFAPRRAAVGWIVVQGVGTLLTLAASVRWGSRQGRSGAEWRFGALMLLIVLFGILWSVVLGRFGPRELNVFWPTFFMFCYCVTGLWFGLAFVALGVAITGLSVAGYFWAGAWLEPYMALVNGGGLILCGLVMRRA